MNFSGGNLDITDTTAEKYEAILNQIQVSTDADFENIITDAVASIQDLNADVLKLNLDQTELQSAGVENGDKLYIRYNAGTTALKSEIDNNDIAFESEFYVDLSELPHLGDATYNANGDDFELTFTQGTFKTDNIDDAKKTAIINQIDIATDVDFSNEITAVITNITVTDSKITLEFDTNQLLNNGVVDGEELHIRYQGMADVLESSNGVDVGDFADKFTVTLPPQLDDAQYDGNQFVLDFNGTDLNISATEPEVQKDDIKVTLSVIAVDGGAEIAGAISSVDTITANEIRPTFDADVLRNAGVASGDELRITYDANHPLWQGIPMPSSSNHLLVQM